jgi:transposase, IS5 family
MFFYFTFPPEECITYCNLDQLLISEVEAHYDKNSKEQNLPEKAMRKVIDLQLKLGEKSISGIQFDPRSRDEIPKLLRGLQALYADREVRAKLFEALSGLVPANVDSNNGRKGMNLWNIFVLGTLRLNCNWDYDKLLEIANNHVLVRQMLCHGIMEEDYQYKLQTLHDNVSLFTPEIADEINRIVVEFGHKVVGKKEDEKLHGSCDSFVMERIGLQV